MPKRALEMQFVGTVPAPEPSLLLSHLLNWTRDRLSLNLSNPRASLFDSRKEAAE
jgi:hypothetical protein